MDHRDLLNQFRVDENIYYIGAFRPPITFLSQQNRALNFVWALQASPFKIKKASICIVGAGLAGLTAASALQVLGADVTVLERASDVMPLQQGNSSRFILPHLFDWPTPGSAYPRTHLPFLNWTAGTAGDIASDILFQWKRIGLTPQFGVDARRVRRIEDQPNVILHDGVALPFDLIVITTGFGLENAHLARHTPHYWRNDDLDQPFISENVFVCLISGIGDGGLIDVLRVATSNFRHGNFLQWVVGNTWLREAAESIQSRIVSGVDQAVVWQDFLDQVIPTEIEEYLIKSRRQRTTVEVVGPGPTPMHGRALISTQIAIAMLWKLNFISYTQGRLTNVERRGRDSYRAAIHEANKSEKSDMRMFHRVITRVGPTNTVRMLIGNAQFLAMSTSLPSSGADRSPTPHYGLFLKDEFMAANQETKFKVIFALGTFGDRGTEVTSGTQASVVAALNLLGQQLGIDSLSEQFTADGITFHTFETEQVWNELSCKFQVANGGITTPRGSCAGPLIIVETNFRSLLDTLLNNDPLRYQSLSIGVTSDVLDAGHLEPVRDLETNVFIEDLRAIDGTLRIASHLGMFQGHRLFSVQDLVAILRNQWEIRRVHNLGWLISAPEQHLKNNWTI